MPSSTEFGSPLSIVEGVAAVVQIEVGVAAASTKLAGEPVKAGEVAEVFDASTEVALKKYVVPVVRPVNVIECAVTSAALLTFRLKELLVVP